MGRVHSATVVSPLPDYGLLTPDALLRIGSLVDEFEPLRRTLMRNQRQRLMSPVPPLEHTAPPPDRTVWQLRPAPLPVHTGMDLTRWAAIHIDHRCVSHDRMAIADIGDFAPIAWPDYLLAMANLRRCAVESSGLPIVVRLRGWRATESNVRLAGRPVPATLVDLTLLLLHGAQAHFRRELVPVIELPVVQDEEEARLYQQLLIRAQEHLAISRGGVKVLLPVESLLCASRLEEVVSELQEHLLGVVANPDLYLADVIRATGIDMCPQAAGLPDQLETCKAAYQTHIADVAERHALPLLQMSLAAPPLVAFMPSDEEAAEAQLRHVLDGLLCYLAAARAGAPDAAALYPRAELCRTLLWQWRARGERVGTEGPRITDALLRLLAAEEAHRLGIDPALTERPLLAAVQADPAQTLSQVAGEER